MGANVLSGRISARQILKEVSAFKIYRPLNMG
jgi:hypothetical protein